jgi:glycosyltransferase involved in cell wall biosynthesis
MLVPMNLSSEYGKSNMRPVPGLTVVIPCFNAGHRIRPVAEGAALQAARVIVVDDGSTDGAVDPLASSPGIEVLRLPCNRGKGHAIIAGLECALAQPGLEAACLMDADGQHDPADIPELVAAFRRERADLVIGQRSFDGTPVPWRSRFGNRVTARVTRLFLGRNLPDTQCGFRVLSPRFARAVVDRVAGGRYETEMEMIVLAVRGGFTLAHAPVRTVYEPGNRSSHFRKVRDSVRICLRLARALTGPR